MEQCIQYTAYSIEYTVYSMHGLNNRSLVVEGVAPSQPAVITSIQHTLVPPLFSFLFAPSIQSLPFYSNRLSSYANVLNEREKGKNAALFSFSGKKLEWNALNNRIIRSSKKRVDE